MVEDSSSTKAAFMASIKTDSDQEVLFVRRNKLIQDVNFKLMDLRRIVGEDERGLVLVNRIKAWVVFAVQRLAHQCLQPNREEAEDEKRQRDAERELKYLRCCIKVYESALEDLRALCASATQGEHSVVVKREREEDEED